MTRLATGSVLCGLAAVTVVTLSAFEPRGNSPVVRQDAPANALRLYVFDCGTLQADPSRFRLTRDEVSTTNLSVPCFLVSHPRGKLMWDPGAVPDDDWKPTGGEVKHQLTLPDGSSRTLTLRKPLLAQLAEIGYSPADITHLAFSHYHYDHTANANAFAAATWLVRRAEHAAMFGPTPPSVALPSSYARLQDSKTILIDADEHDVFGDGTVIMKLAAGHTPAHQVLYVKLPKTGGVVLSGDLYHFPEARTLKRVTTFDHDQMQTPIARAAIEAFLLRTGAQLWIQHDYAGNTRLKKAPLYYE